MFLIERDLYLVQGTESHQGRLFSRIIGMKLYCRAAAATASVLQSLCIIEDTFAVCAISVIMDEEFHRPIHPDAECRDDWLGPYSRMSHYLSMSPKGSVRRTYCYDPWFSAPCLRDLNKSHQVRTHRET